VEQLPATAFVGPGGVAGPWEGWLDLAAGPFFLTTPEPGERFAPLGMGGRTTALGDLFTDRKIAPPLRAGWPLVVDADGAIAWVCGIAVAHHAAVTAQTTELVRLHWLACTED
jgi:tRNA(Ile)-lysidine synthase